MYFTKKDILIPFSSSWACIGLHWVLWACIDLRWPLLACVGCCLLDGLGPGHGCSHRDPHPNPRTPGPVTRSGLADPCHSLTPSGLSLVTTGRCPWSPACFTLISIFHNELLLSLKRKQADREVGTAEKSGPAKKKTRLE